jgi:hypothetical protein
LFLGNEDMFAFLNFSPVFYPLSFDGVHVSFGARLI